MKELFYKQTISELLKILEKKGCYITENRYCTIASNGFEDVIFPKFRLGTIEFYFCKYQKIIQIFRHKTQYKRNCKSAFMKMYNRRYQKIEKSLN